MRPMRRGQNTCLRRPTGIYLTPMKRHHGLRNATQALDFIAKED